MIRWWIALWDRREAPTVLALIRIGVGIVLLGDFLTVWGLDLVAPLWSSTEAGGLSRAGQSSAPPLWFVLFGGGAFGARLLDTALVLVSLTLAIGWFSRTSALVLMLLYAQSAMILPEADRAIDMLLRNVLMILALSGCGATWSLDALWRTGRWGPDVVVPAWPRYLLVLQLVVMYTTAGIQKYAQHWWPWGGYSALYVILNDWAYAKYRFGWLSSQPFYALTQLSTGVTMFFQWTYPVVLLHYFPPPGSAGPIRRGMARWQLHWLWIAVGGLFHLLIAATMALGIFPWGMLALYPAYLHPDELSALGRRWVRWRGGGRRGEPHGDAQARP